MPEPSLSYRVPLRSGLLGLAVLAAYAVLVEWLIGWGELVRGLLQAGPLPVVWVLAGLLASYVLRALRIRAALVAIPRRDLLEVVRLFALYNLSNWLLPARLGEASLPLLLWRRYAVAPGRGTGILLWLRLLDLHVLAVLAGLLLILHGTGVWQALGLAALLAGLPLPVLGARFLAGLARRWPRLLPLVEVLPTRPYTAGGDLALAWAAWLVKLGALGAALSVFTGLSYGAGILGALGGDVSGVLPLHAPLGAGSYEAGVLLALTPWRPELSVALAAAVQLHLLLLAAALALGALGLPALGRRMS